MIKLNGDEDTLVIKKWVFIPFDCNKRSPASDFKSEDNFDLMPNNFDRALFQIFSYFTILRWIYLNFSGK